MNTATDRFSFVTIPSDVRSSLARDVEVLGKALAASLGGGFSAGICYSGAGITLTMQPKRGEHANDPACRSRVQTWAEWTEATWPGRWRFARERDVYSCAGKGYAFIEYVGPWRDRPEAAPVAP